jgi:hypothetical protein
MPRRARPWKRYCNMSIVPSKWELLLADLGMDEQTAFEAAPSDARLLNFIRRHCHSRFVPERVLKALGLMTF